MQEEILFHKSHINTVEIQRLIQQSWCRNKINLIFPICHIMGDKGQRKAETWHQNIYLFSQTRSLPRNPNHIASAAQDKSTQRTSGCMEGNHVWCKASEASFWETGARELWNDLLTILLAQKPFDSMPENAFAYCFNALIHPVLLTGRSKSKVQSVHPFKILPLPIWEAEIQGTEATHFICLWD